MGDCVYQLYPLNTVGDYGISKLRVTGIVIDTGGVAFDKELIGKQFFFTEEEAELAKKERESNA